MNLPLPLLLTLALLLGAWLTWLALRRANRRWLLGRLLACWGIVACLVLLVHPPKIDRTYSASEAILLTQGFNPDTVQRLLTQLRPRPQVYSFEVETPVAKQLTDLHVFKEKHPTVQTLHVVGHGLEQKDIEALESLQLVPHLAEFPAGIVEASWPQHLFLGQEVQVQGSFRSPEKETKLYLTVAGKPQDSVEMKPGETQAFSLRFTPKANGQFVYHLQWKTEADSVQQEAIPVTVQVPKKLSVLLLGSAPSFEMKFLKNELARQGHSVAVRTQVSQNIYQTEFINFSSLSVQALTPNLLEKFDLVMLDATALQNLTAAERQALQEAVREQGLGVFTSFSGDRPKAIPFFAEAVFKPISEKQGKNAPIRWPGVQSRITDLATPAYTMALSPEQQALAWVTSLPDSVVTAIYRNGLGQVGISLMPETFPLALSDQEKAYQSYWAHIVTTLAKPYPQTTWLAPLSPSPVKIHQPAAFLASKSVGKIVSESNSEENGVNSHSGALPYQHVLSFWPLQTGWQTALAGSDTVGTFYVHPANAWPLVKIQAKRHAMLTSAQKSPAMTPKSEISVRKEMPLWPLALLVSLGMFFLWVEEKL